MPEYVHPRNFLERFGVKVSHATLSRWRRQLGFPASIDVPRGHYIAAEVEAWFKRRAAEARSKSA